MKPNAEGLLALPVQNYGLVPLNLTENQVLGKVLGETRIVTL